jgi:hypothetical protein
MKLTNVIKNLAFEKVKSLKYDKVLNKIFLINVLFVFTGVVFFIFSISNLNSEFFTNIIIALCIVFFAFHYISSLYFCHQISKNS